MLIPETVDEWKELLNYPKLAIVGSAIYDELERIGYPDDGYIRAQKNVIVDNTKEKPCNKQ